MKLAVTAAILVGVWFVSSASARTISCDFESDPASVLAYPDISGDYDPNAVSDTGSNSSWSTVEGQLTGVQVTSYGTPGAHSGSKYLRLNRNPANNNNDNAMAQLFSGSGTPMFGPVVTIDTWLRSEGATWQNQIAVTGSGGDVANVVYFNTTDVYYLNGGWTDTGLNWTPGIWQHMVISLDLGTDKMSISLDGNTVSNLPFISAASYVNIFQFAASGGPGDSYFDDIVVSDVPEPATISMILLGLGSFLLRRRS